MRVGEKECSERRKVGVAFAKKISRVQENEFRCRITRGEYKNKKHAQRR